MPFSHHSHSGEFCNHATDQLEEIIQEAIRQGMQVFALTEHMPRDQEADLYPGEGESGWSIAEQAVIFDKFHRKARELQVKYKDQIELLVGMEIDWIRAESQQWIEQLLSKYQFDLFVGSVHHVHGIPIDFDQAYYDKVINTCLERAAAAENVSAEQMLFEDYYDTQYDMLRALRPPVVGHFDLIRLLSKDRDASWKSCHRVWDKIKRNLHYIQDYGGVLELNSSGLRKGMREPYPKLEICVYFNRLGGKFTLSDDSHGVAQVGHSYHKLMNHASESSIHNLTVFHRAAGGGGQDQRFPNTITETHSISASSTPTIK